MVWSRTDLSFDLQIASRHSPLWGNISPVTPLTSSKEDGSFIHHPDASQHGIFCVTRKELLSVVEAVDHYRSFLYGRRFLIRSNSSTVQWLLHSQIPEGQIVRWLEKLQTHSFENRHRKGKSHSNADGFSRRRGLKAGCKFYQRLMDKDLQFLDDVSGSSTPTLRNFGFTLIRRVVTCKGPWSRGTYPRCDESPDYEMVRSFTNPEDKIIHLTRQDIGAARRKVWSWNLYDIGLTKE